MPTDLDIIKEQLSLLEGKMLSEEKRKLRLLRQVHEDQYQSAKNLIHYLVLRNEDRRDLQELLHVHGLSSLASSESHVHHQLQAIKQRLGFTYPENEIAVCSYVFGQMKMKEKSKLLFGSKTATQIPSIMVTFDSGFASDRELIKSLLENGMNVARINCAHDDETIWAEMIQNLKGACTETGLECKIYMDLAGPKIRTRLLGRGKRTGKAKIKEGQLIWFVDPGKEFNKREVVISPS
jgi:pyruvate kinase